MSALYQNAQAELCGPNKLMLKVIFRQLKMACDTRIIHFYYTLERAALAWTKSNMFN